MRNEEDIDWKEVEKIIRGSLLGFGVSDYSLIEKARKLDRKRYIELHTQIKNEEISMINPLFKPKD